MIGKISKTENAIKVDGESGTIRLMIDVIESDEDAVAFFIGLIGQEFEITINGSNATTQKRIRYYG